MSAAGGYPAEGEAAEGKKEKKPRPAPPAPPAALGTAALLIRGAAARVLGLRPGPCGGDVQPVWVTEPGCCKITISLEGSSRTPFPKDEVHKELIDAIEAEVNKLASADLPVSIFELGKADAEKKFGDAMYEPKSAKPDTLRLAYVPGAVLVEVASNWTLCASTASCGKITFLQKEVEAGSKKKPDTMILAKKKQLMIKYEVANPDAAPDAASAAPDASKIKELDSGAVRVEVAGVDTAKAGAEEASTADAPEEKVDLRSELIPLKLGELQKRARGMGVSQDALDDALDTEDAAASLIKCILAQAEALENAEAVVDPWEVKGKIDYGKLINKFGSTAISPALLERMEKLTVGAGRVPCLHRWLRRNIFFSHRDFEAVCKAKEQGTPFYLYTGRGPNSVAMHLGHLLPFMFTKWLQEAFDVPLVIQMTDDEKFLWKGEYDAEKGDNLHHFRYLTVENAKDIIACGFDKKKTFIFSDCEYMGHMYPNVVKIWKAITYNTARGAFGFAGDSNIGQSAFPAIQAAPSFPSTFRVPLRGNDKMACLIPCAIDQDPYFRVTRDIAHKLVPTDHPLKGKPSLIHCKFFPPLQGTDGKMSSSDSNSAIFLMDTPEQIETKIKEHAFSGGRQTAKEQREKGADLDIDVPYQWLRFFLEDDEELALIGKEYGTGQGKYWSTGAVKERLIEVLKPMLKEHQERRAKITDKEVAEWMAVRELDF